MELTDAMRHAENEHVIYFLLSAYIHASADSAAPAAITAPVGTLPLAGADDAKSRFMKLMFELDAASKRLDNDACNAIKEALSVFGIALHRLQFLAGRRTLATEREKRAA